MVLRGATSLLGALEGVGPENLDFLGPNRYINSYYTFDIHSFLAWCPHWYIGAPCHEKIRNAFETFDTLLSCLASIAMKRLQMPLMLLIHSFLAWHPLPWRDQKYFWYFWLALFFLGVILMLLIHSFLAWRPLPWRDQKYCWYFWLALFFLGVILMLLKHSFLFRLLP